MLNNNKITIGIPTYKRNKHINKALNSISNQTYKNINVVISNNSSDEQDIDQLDLICSNYKDKIKNLEIINQKKNIGAIPNYLYLLSICKTEFFMWLADDDEISENCIEILLSDIIKNDKIVTVALYWNHIINEKNSNIIIPCYFNNSLRIFRVIKFLYKSDDSFFYGLHRKKFLEVCQYNEFWRPNKNNILNWCYPYIFQLVLQGKITLVSDKNAIWHNNEFTYKHTLPNLNVENKIYKHCKILIKNINIYFLYLKYILKTKDYILIFMFIGSIILFISNDFFRFLITKFVKKKYD